MSNILNANPSKNHSLFPKVRAIQNNLSKNTPSPINLTLSQQRTYNAGGKVWLTLQQHRIDLEDAQRYLVPNAFNNLQFFLQHNNNASNMAEKESESIFSTITGIRYPSHPPYFYGFRPECLQDFEEDGKKNKKKKKTKESKD